MNINSLHFSSKPSYKLIRSGAATLDTAELLAIVLEKGRQEERVMIECQVFYPLMTKLS